MERALYFRVLGFHVDSKGSLLKKLFFRTLILKGCTVQPWRLFAEECIVVQPSLVWVVWVLVVSRLVTVASSEDSEMKERWSVKHHTHKSSAYHTKPNQTNIFIIEFSAQIQHRFITALGVRKVMDSSAGQLRLGLGCQCKDDTVQPSLGLRVSAKYLHSAHRFSAF